jgi:hypothetical protein
MQKITFHKLSMGDVDDPELYAAQPLYEWQQTDQGQWVMENCSDPQYIIRPDVNTFGNKIIVYGEIEDQLATEYLLRWGQ